MLLPEENLFTLLRDLPFRNLLPGATAVVGVDAADKKALLASALLDTGLRPVMEDTRAAASFFSNFDNVEEILFDCVGVE